MTHEKAYEKAYDLYHTYMKQHIEGFNFFLVISGLLFNALIDVYEKYSVLLVIVICGLEMLISIVFFLSDIRSTQYMKAAKNVLLQIEAEMCETGECKTGAVSAIVQEKKRLRAGFRMTYVFRIVYTAFFVGAVVLLLLSAF